MDKAIQQVKNSIVNKMNKLVTLDKKRDKKIKSHLKEDIKTFTHEAQEDKKLIKSLEGNENGRKKKKR